MHQILHWMQDNFPEPRFNLGYKYTILLMLRLTFNQVALGVSREPIGIAFSVLEKQCPQDESEACRSPALG